MAKAKDEPITGMYEVLDALEATLQAADPAKRKALAQTIDAYHRDFPDDFHWAVGASAPTLLSHLIITMDVACRSASETKTRGVIRLVDRKPEGNA